VVRCDRQTPELFSKNSIAFMRTALRLLPITGDYH
jgi:hypothetical protein